MKAYKDDDFNGRLNMAAKAKLAMIKSHRAKAGFGDSAVVGPRAVKRAISVAPEARDSQDRVGPESSRGPGE